jgi:hypothetical protein
VLEHERSGYVIEASWLEKPELDPGNRKGVECELIAAYRKAMGGKIPLANSLGTYPVDLVSAVFPLMRSSPIIRISAMRADC